MRPEPANLFSINSNGQNENLILSFFFEWHDTDGKNVNIKQEKVSSVVISVGNFLQLADAIGSVAEQIREANNESGDE